MYTPPAFRWDDRGEALRLAAQRNFAALVTIVGAAPTVTHLPFLIDEARGVLRGHLARANPHAAHLDGREHLAIFAGPHAYVSPDWYGETGADVPTWNYLSVHVAGRGRALSDDAAVDRFLADLAAHEERRRPDLASGGRIWTIDKIASGDHARLRRAIIAFEIDIARVDAKAKLSQNKSREAAARVADVLAAAGTDAGVALAAFMRAEPDRRR